MVYSLKSVYLTHRISLKNSINVYLIYIFRKYYKLLLLHNKKFHIIMWVMLTHNATKINQLLQSIPSGVAVLSCWLQQQGYSPQLQQQYRHNGWLQSIGTGAMIRVGDRIDIYGAVYTLQHQSALHIHIGGRTALAMLGKAQYVSLGRENIHLFGHGKQKLPKWFTKYTWKDPYIYHNADFLLSETGKIDFEWNDRIKLHISSPARAVMECLYLTPFKQDIIECYDLMENIGAVRPAVAQELLENSKSVKVNRLFLCFAEMAGHAWFKHIDTNTINLGTGKRQIAKNGVYMPTYKITIPKELVQNDV